MEDVYGNINNVVGITRNVIEPIELDICSLISGLALPWTMLTDNCERSRWSKLESHTYQELER